MVVQNGSMNGSGGNGTTGGRHGADEIPPPEIIWREYNGNRIAQRPNDGYFSATDMCKATDKLVNDYLRSVKTKEFLEALSGDTGIPVSRLVEVRKGNVDGSNTGGGQGTWVHKYVAIDLATWANPHFRLQVMKWAFEIISGRMPTVPIGGFDPAMAERIDRIEMKLVQIIEAVATRNGMDAEIVKALNDGNAKTGLLCEVLTSAAGEFRDAGKQMAVLAKLQEVRATLPVTLAPAKRTQAEKREAIKTELAAHPDWTDNLIATTVGVDDQTVKLVRAEMEAAGDIPRTPTRTDARGHVRKAPPSEPVKAEVEPQPVAALPECPPGRKSIPDQQPVAEAAVPPPAKSPVAETLFGAADVFHPSDADYAAAWEFASRITPRNPYPIRFLTKPDGHEVLLGTTQQQLLAMIVYLGATRRRVAVSPAVVSAHSKIHSVSFHIKVLSDIGVIEKTPGKRGKGGKPVVRYTGPAIQEAA